jgi:GNAT superfamily N-acetyltransferase
MAGITVRNATSGDFAAISRVALATGQDEEWAGADPAYLRYLLANGTLVVALADDGVAGFGATRLIGEGPTAVSMLCDLFVHPDAHGRGCGRAMLAELWRDEARRDEARRDEARRDEARRDEARRDEPRRMTFSSLHSHALPLYTRFGLDAWWPLLYLSGDVTTLRVPDGWAAFPFTPEQAAAAEQRWTGVDRLADHRAWAARPHGQPMAAFRAGQLRAAGTVAGDGAEYGIVHLAIAPRAAGAHTQSAGGADTQSAAGAHTQSAAPTEAQSAAPAEAQVAGGAYGPSAGGTETPSAAGAEARDAVLAVLAALQPPGGRARVCLPAPHPAVRPLLAAGWHNEDIDLFMASEPALLDPRRGVPSPGGA